MTDFKSFMELAWHEMWELTTTDVKWSEVDWQIV